MQAMGLINDHAEGCVVRAKVARARRAFRPPAGPGPRLAQSRASMPLKSTG
jgi:hypothetical protein